MLYKYEKACMDAGMDEEKIREIRRFYGNEYKRLERHKEEKAKSGIIYLSYEAMKDDYGDGLSYDIPDPSPSVEDIYIRNTEIRILNEILAQMKKEDREFILTYYAEGCHAVAKLEKMFGLTERQVRYRQKKVLRQIRERFLEKTGYVLSENQ